MGWKLAVLGLMVRALMARSLIRLDIMLSGYCFGIVLTVSGVYKPAVIFGQLYLWNFYMMNVFLTATALSALIIFFARTFEPSGCKARGGSSVGLFSRYDGNILGGLLQGIGMGMAGACPGTALVQYASGLSHGPYVFLGCIIGGILWSGYGTKLHVKECQFDPAIGEEKPTFYEKLGISESTGLVLFEVVVLSTIAAISKFAPISKTLTLLPPIIAGYLLACSQAASICFTSKTLGVSHAFEQVGDLFWYIFSPVDLSKPIKAVPDLTSVIFALAVMDGATMAGWVIDTSSHPMPMSFTRGVIGGIFISFGERLAGGCASGHGISGLGKLGFSSLITVAAIFGGGIGFVYLNDLILL